MKELSKDTKSGLLALAILLGVTSVIILLIFIDSIEMGYALSNVLFGMMGIAGLLLILGIGGYLLLSIFLIIIGCLGLNDSGSSTQDLILSICFLVVGIFLSIKMIKSRSQSVNGRNNESLGLKALKSIIKDIHLCSNCASLSPNKYEEDKFLLFDAVHKLTTIEENESKELALKAILKKIESYELCENCSNKIKTKIKHYLKDFTILNEQKLELKKTTLGDD